jgi:hypothetical protein
MPAAFAFNRARDFPLHVGNFLGDPSIDLALEIFDNLCAPLRPIICRRHLRPVLENHQLGQRILVEIGSRFVGSVRGARITSPAYFRDAQLREHVLIVVITGGDVIG